MKNNEDSNTSNNTNSKNSGLTGKQKPTVKNITISAIMIVVIAILVWSIYDTIVQSDRANRKYTDEYQKVIE